MEKSRLDDLPLFERYAATHNAEEEHGKGDDAETADLEKDKGDDLPGEGEVFTDV